MLVFRGVTHDGSPYIKVDFNICIYIWDMQTCNIHLFDIIGDYFSWMFSKHYMEKQKCFTKYLVQGSIGI